MAQMKVIVRDHTGAKKTPVQLPDDVPMRRLIPALVTKMSLPTTQAGQPLTYELDHKRTGKRLREEDTLQSAGVQPEDILTLLPQVTAGSATASPRVRRLQSDHERLQKLVMESDLIRIAATEGYPPEKYVIEFTCRGVERLNRGQPVFSSYHRVGIYLTAGYPTRAPQMRWLTEIFHPNISSGGSVCVGTWYASKWLDELVYMLAEMVQYRNYDDALDNILNSEAATWARENRHLFPVDPREIKSIGEGALDELMDRIRIGGEPDEGILDQITIL